MSTMLGEGADRRSPIAAALQVEVDEFLALLPDRRDGQGRAAVVLNGLGPVGRG